MQAFQILIDGFAISALYALGATGFTIDLVFSTDDAVGFATAIMHMAHIGKTADPPTFN